MEQRQRLYPFHFRKIVTHILQILNAKMTTGALSADQKQRLKMGMQRLKTAFGLNQSDLIFSTLFPVGVKATQNVAALPSIPIANVLAEAACVNTGPPYIKPAELSNSHKDVAKELKNRGVDAFSRLELLELKVNYSTAAIALDGNNPLFFSTRASAYNKLDRFGAAIRDCQIALQLQPSCALAYAQMGVANMLQNYNVDAILCFWLCSELLTDELDPLFEMCMNNIEACLNGILDDVATAQAQALESPNLETCFRNPYIVPILSKSFRRPVMVAFWAFISGYFTVGGFRAGAPGMLKRFELMSQNLYAGLRNLNHNWSLILWPDL